MNDLERPAVRKRKATQKTDAISKGFRYLESIQEKDGGWHGDYGGPLFLVPGYVFAHYATGTEISPKVAKGLIRYIESVQNEDGGFGLHIEAKSYMFTSAINYVALRLLGVAKTAPSAKRAREWIRKQPGAVLGAASWGKFWLCVLGLYEYEGINPVLPELWLAPTWLPVHPSLMWCHARVVYLPMSYLYGRRWRVEETPLLAEIRDEIHDRPYATIDWQRARGTVHPNDLYTPHSPVLRAANKVLGLVEQGIQRIPRLQKLRDKALALVLDHIRHEETSTRFVALGPVNKCLDAIACFAAAPGTEHTQRAIAGMNEYLFDGEDGLKMQGYHSSELWDTAFTLQALAASGRGDEFLAMAKKAYAFIDRTQIKEDVDEREKYFRDPTKGGWGFSNEVNGWPVFDCTSDGVKAALAFEHVAAKPMAKERLFDSIDFMLWGQEPSGAWCSYEKRRGHPLLELLNPSEVFGRIMVEYPYVELSASTMAGLVKARDHYGDALGTERLAKIATALSNGERYVRAAQRIDGSWEGSWGVCFTYGTWFGVMGLRACGASPDDPALQQAVEFLLRKQNKDGGWGESYLSCETRDYVQHPDGSQVVMTAWALLALIQAGRPEAQSAIERGVALLEERQLANGDWPKEGIAGVFNRTCMIHYRFYRNYFPLWALALAKS
ncbi:MAG: terpene cyclase/mutase family protein [Deltaproteobacteria bacterium]|nr:terpene cyclase/mutase family protein [Deltaproteobacteria bacterium]